MLCIVKNKIIICSIFLYKNLNIVFFCLSKQKFHVSCFSGVLKACGRVVHIQGNVYAMEVHNTKLLPCFWMSFSGLLAQMSVPLSHM